MERILILGTVPKSKRRVSLLLKKRDTFPIRIGTVPIILLIFAILSLNLSGCCRPPKDPYEVLRTELKDKAVDFKVEYLIDVIQGSATAREKKAAVRLLSEIGKPSVAAIIEKIKDDKTRHRDDYLLALKLIGGPAAADVITLLHSDKPLVREEAFAVLLAIGKDGVSELIKSLRKDKKDIRPTIISLLATIKDRRAAEPLSNIFMDVTEDSKIREQALAALVSIGKPAVPYLAQALHSKDEETKKAASLAIERIGRGR
ncbi:MAG: hypothetical protein AMJ78_03475 [Omnitrophica WOR_2 bacterium SM23_29]|nr:MAG: hypothetical protein AMJ78_03475 [Omnitrophica WOR_2 bacterium SM23_29]